MAFELPALPYAFDALEPYIDARTMEIHYTKHHAAYLSNLNAALDKAPQIGGFPVEYLLTHLDLIPEDIRLAVRNNGGGYLNHTFFWNSMAPEAGGEPVGELGQAIQTSFGSHASFKEQFEKAGLSRFGSGWAWLSMRKDGSLFIHSTPNQDSPLTEGFSPLLGVDVWEHAYYLKYQNRRADYLTNWWNVVNWKEAERRFQNNH